MRHAPSTRNAVRLAAAAVACVWLCFPAAASVVEQTFQLEPGWNAIWLEVQPEPNDVETVFAGLPVASVWTWEPGSSRVRFLRDPSEGLLNRPGWLGYFPPGPEQFLTNLHTLRAHRAYMVRLPDDAPPMALTVTGRLSPRSFRWTPNSFNLVGFPVDPQTPPTFGAFLAPSSAHAGQPVYRLAAAGRWEQVLDPWTQRIRAGEAYWVYADGASSYTSPLEVDVGSGLEFGSFATEKLLRIRRTAGGAGTVTIRRWSSSADPVPLCYWELQEVTDPDSGQSYPRAAWPDLGAEYPVDLSADGTASLRLGVRRELLESARAEEVLEVLDGAGTRLLIPVGVEPSVRTESSTFHINEGLWVGTVSITEVNEVNDSVDPDTPTPAPASFSFRLILHVDTDGITHLLTQVFRMWVWDTYPTAGHYVLISDDDDVPLYDPSQTEDGYPVSHRISAVAYDFDGDVPPDSNALPSSGGSFGGTGPGALQFTLDLGEAASTNPFVHWYHPDHDDDHQAADIDYDPADPSGVRGGPYHIVRTWTLDFQADDPQNPGDPPPGYGVSLFGGTFQETINGLHKSDVKVLGEFRLWRTSTIATLNP